MLAQRSSRLSPEKSFPVYALVPLAIECETLEPPSTPSKYSASRETSELGHETCSMVSAGLLEDPGRRAAFARPRESAAADARGTL